MQRDKTSSELKWLVRDLQWLNCNTILNTGVSKQTSQHQFAGSGPEARRDLSDHRRFYHLRLLFSFHVVNFKQLQKLLTMPDVSKHAAVLQDLKNGTIRTLGVSIGPVTITPGQKIAKAGENTDFAALI